MILAIAIVATLAATGAVTLLGIFIFLFHNFPDDWQDVEDSSTGRHKA